MKKAEQLSMSTLTLLRIVVIKISVTVEKHMHVLCNIYSYANKYSIGTGDMIIYLSWSSDFDDDDYNVPPVSNIARKKKQIRVIPVVKKTLNTWQAYIKSNYDKIGSLQKKQRFKKLIYIYI